MRHAHMTAIRVGGYRVGSEPSHIRFSTSRSGIIEVSIEQYLVDTNRAKPNRLAFLLGTSVPAYMKEFYYVFDYLLQIVCYLQPLMG